MLIKYKLCHTSFTNDLKYPVFAGEDGSIVVFDIDRKRWTQLNQSHDKSNGYWVVSIPKKVVDNDKSRLEKDVHVLICHAWRGDRPSPAHRVDHVNGNQDDNAAENLAWIKPLANATKAKLSDKQFPASFQKIIIDCSKLRSGQDILSAVSVITDDGKEATTSELVGRGHGRPTTRISSLLESLYRHTKKKGREKHRFEIDATKISTGDHPPVPETITIDTSC